MTVIDISTEIRENAALRADVDFVKGIDKQITDIALRILRVHAPSALRAAQADGFPKDKKDYASFIRLDRQERKADPATFNPFVFRIGTKANPSTIRYVALSTNLDEAFRATQFAHSEVLRIAAKVSRRGHYKKSIYATLNDYIIALPPAATTWAHLPE